MVRIATLIILLFAVACQVKGKSDSSTLISGNQTVTNKFSVTIPASGTYKQGDTLTFTLTFPYAVTVTGLPRLALNVGGATAYASYASGDGTKTQTYTYTIAAGMNDSDGITVSSLIDLNGGGLDFTGSAGAASCNVNISVPATSGVKVDTTAPTILSLTPPSNTTYLLNTPLYFYVTYSENVVVTGTPRLVLTIGSATRYATYASGAGTATLLFSYTVGSTDVDSNGITMLTSVDLNSGNITDSATNVAGTTFAGPNLTGVLVDGDTPYVTSISAPVNKNYVSGQAIDFSFTYSEPVLVTGTPSLALVVGATARTATYQSGSGTSTLSFRHIVQAGDLDTDGITAASTFTLTGATIKDAGGTNALNVFSLPSLTGVTVNDSNPHIASFTVTNGTYFIGQQMTIVANFDQAVTVTGTPQLPITLDTGGTVNASYVSGSGTNALTFTYTVASGTDDPTGITITSPLSLNGGTISALGLNAVLTFTSPSTPAVLVSGTAPTITSVVPPSNGTYLTGQNLDFTVNFSEVVTAATTANIKLQLTIGAATKYATYLSGSGTTALVFRYTVTAPDADIDGLNVVSLNVTAPAYITDTNSSFNLANLTLTPPNTTGVLVNATIPSIASVTPPANATYFIGQNLNFTVNYSENVTVTGTPRIPVTLDTGGTVYATYVSGSGTTALLFTYTIVNGTDDANGITVVSPLDVNGGALKSANGVNASLTFTPPNTTAVLVSGTRPTVTSVTPPANATYTTGQNLTFVVNFSENVIVGNSANVNLNLTIGSTSRNATYFSGSGTSAITFRYTVVAGDGDVDGIAINTLNVTATGYVTDTNSTNNLATVTFTPPNTAGVLVNATTPTISSVTPPANATYFIGQNLNFTVNYSENVTVTGTPRIPVTLDTGGTVYATYVSGSGTTALLFAYTIVNGTDDTNGITVVSPLDVNGGTLKSALGLNASLTFTPPTTTAVLVSGTRPTITSVTPPANATYLTGQNLTFVVNFSENVIVGNSANVNLNLTIGSTSRNATYFSGSGTSAITFRYTVVAGDGDVDGIAINTLNVTATGYVSDTNSTNNLATVTFTPPNTAGVLVNATTPTISSVTKPANATYIIGQNLDFIVNYSENVTVTGTPTLAITVGSTARTATYLSGSGTTALTFRYTVPTNDVDTDGITASSPLALAGGTIKSALALDASLSFTPPTMTLVLVDGDDPNVTSTILPNNTLYTVNNTSLTFKVNFDQNVTVVGIPRWQINVGGTIRYATYTAGTGTTQLTFVNTINAADIDLDGMAIANSGNLDLNGGTIKDASGNNAQLSLLSPNLSGIYLTFPGMMGWYDLDVPSTVTTTACGVNSCASAVQDRTGSGYDLSQSGTPMPTYFASGFGGNNRGYLKFDDANDFMNLITVMPTIRTQIIVFQTEPAAMSIQDLFWSSVNGTNARIQITAAGGLSYGGTATAAFGKNGAALSAAATTGAAALAASTNYILVIQYAANQTVASVQRVGNTNFGGRIAEMMTFSNNALTAAQITTIVNYLNAKHAVY